MQELTVTEKDLEDAVTETRYYANADMVPWSDMPHNIKQIFMQHFAKIEIFQPQLGWWRLLDCKASCCPSCKQTVPRQKLVEALEPKNYYRLRGAYAAEVFAKGGKAC